MVTGLVYLSMECEQGGWPFCESNRPIHRIANLCFKVERYIPGPGLVEMVTDLTLKEYPRANQNMQKIITEYEK